jgi:LacI family transcriptional regulator
VFLARYYGYEGYLRDKGAFDSGLVAVDETRAGERQPPQETPPDMQGLLEQVWDKNTGKRPTAIITANDWMAKGLYSSLQRKGLRVPDDISVVGFDNARALCESLDPPLTSYDVPFAAVAREGTLALLYKIDNPHIPSDHALRLVRGTIVERKSIRTIEQT